MGKLQNFAVALDNQTGVFYAGQVVSGNIQVDLMEPMKMRRKFSGLSITIGH
jgi:hypothetical protein